MLTPAKNKLFSVSSLNRSAADVLDSHFSWIWVEGEISNLARPASGHLYFSLKDSRAQVRCAMFRGSNSKLTFVPDNGQQVLVRAKVSLYQPRGDYQLIVDRMEESGDGALQRQFELLKQKLAAEGLFDETYKQDIPELPEKIGIITSGSGAALHDILSVIERRFPSIAVTLYPVPVQGNEAAPAICKALQQLPAASACDVILLARGGGSLEDLWSFNEESVARAIFDCDVPVVTGIGHEVDVTIADFVADIRAATPTAAAETVTPDQHSWSQNFDWYQQRLQQLMQDKLQHKQEKTQWLSKRLEHQHPQNIIQRAQIQCDNAQARLQRIWSYTLNEKALQLKQGQAQLSRHHPGAQLIQKKQNLHFNIQRLQQQMQLALKQNKNRLSHCARTLHTISPLQTLERGYSITLDTNKTTITTTKQLKLGDIIETRLHEGLVHSRVEQLK